MERISRLNADLHIDIQADASKVVLASLKALRTPQATPTTPEQCNAERIADIKLAGEVDIQLIAYMAVGCTNQGLGMVLSERTEKHAGVMKRPAFTKPLQARRSIWTSHDFTMSYGLLYTAARRLLSMHAASCGPELSLSPLGNMYSSLCTRLG